MKPVEKIAYDTDEEAQQIKLDRGSDKQFIEHINTDGSKELHIIDGAPELSLEERVALLEEQVSQLLNQ
jgi:hypothetical protein